MTHLPLKNGDTIFFAHHDAAPDKPTFAFLNALTGDTAMWSAQIAPALEACGFGTLLFNYRGQKHSKIADDVEISASQITQDCQLLLAHLNLSKLVAVGLSIGGYFSIRAQLDGTSIAGHVLLNTLRADGPRLAWVNAATYRAVRTGGAPLLRDLYAPLLFNQEWQQQNRQNFLQDQEYAAVPATHIDARLMAAGASANWDIDWEQIDVPVEVVTGMQDRVFRDETSIAAILNRLPDAHACDLPDCGHMIPVEKPQAVIDACKRIAERLP